MINTDLSLIYCKKKLHNILVLLSFFLIIVIRSEFHLVSSFVISNIRFFAQYSFNYSNLIKIIPPTHLVGHKPIP